MAKVTVRWSETTPQQRKKMIRDLAKRWSQDETLESLIATMHEFEEKYGMSTVEFYARFVSGKMGDSRDFILWAGAFHDYQHLLQTHFLPKTEAA